MYSKLILGYHNYILYIITFTPFLLCIIRFSRYVLWITEVKLHEFSVFRCFTLFCIYFYTFNNVFSVIRVPSNVGLFGLHVKYSAQMAGEYADSLTAWWSRHLHKSFRDMTLNWWKGFTLVIRLRSWNFVNIEYPFIAITPRSTLTRRGSIC